MSETAVEQLMPVNSDGSVDMEDLKTLARNNITLAKLVEKQGSAYLEVLEKLQNATDVAVTGASVHENLTDIMWDALGPYHHGSDSGESVPHVVGEEIVSDKHNLLLTCQNLTSFYSSGKECGCSGGELVLQAMKVTQGQCPEVEAGVVHGPCNMV